MFYLTEIISKKVLENSTFQRLKRIRNNFSWIKEIWRQTISVWWLKTSGPRALKFPQPFCCRKGDPFRAQEWALV